MRLFSFKPALIGSLALLCAGCFGGGSTPSEFLTLSPTLAPPPGDTRSAAGGDAIAIMTPTVPRAVNTRRIPVYVTDITIEYLVNANWVEEPNELFRRLLAETIAARTGRVVLDPANFSQEPGATLGGQLLQFGFDPTRMQVVAAYEGALTRGDAPLQTRRFEARVPVTTQTAATIAPALNQAANQVAEEVAAWIAAG